MGSPDRLKREMSAFGGLVITLTNLSPSIGVFIAAPVIIQQSGSFAIMACLLALLLGVVVAKLFLVELADRGTVSRIVSFMVVGVLMLAVGYFAPIPPRRPDAEPAPQDVAGETA